MPLDELSIIDRFFRPLAGEGAFGLLDDAGIDRGSARSRPRRHHRHGRLRRAFPSRRSGGHGRAEGASREPLRSRGEGRDAARLHAEPRPAGRISTRPGSPLSPRGWRATSRHFAIGLLGGDTIACANGPVVSVTAFGRVPKGRMVHRSGGKPGDVLYVSGTHRRRRGRAGAAEGRGGSVGRSPGGGARGAGRPLPRAGAAGGAFRRARRVRIGGDGCLRRACRRLRQALRRLGLLRHDRRRRCAASDRALPRRATKRRSARLLTSGDDYEILAAVPPAEVAGSFRAAAEAGGVPVARIGALDVGRRPDQGAVQGCAASSIKTRLRARAAEETR